jgi:hypothetical protein
MTHGDDTTKEQAAIALASLMTDQYLVTSDDNPRLMHITDEGVAWHQARAAEYAAEQAIASPAV